MWQHFKNSSYIGKYLIVKNEILLHNRIELMFFKVPSDNSKQRTKSILMSSALYTQTRFLQHGNVIFQCVSVLLYPICFH